MEDGKEFMLHCETTNLFSAFFVFLLQSDKLLIQLGIFTDP